MLHFEDIFTVWNFYGTDKVLKLGTTNNGKDYGEITISSATKNKETGEFKIDFRGNIRFYGACLDKVKSLGLIERDRVKIKGNLQNIGVNGKVTQYVNITCWEIEKVDKVAEVPKAPTVVGEFQPIDIPPDQLPF